MANRKVEFYPLVLLMPCLVVVINPQVVRAESDADVLARIRPLGIINTVQITAPAKQPVAPVTNAMPVQTALATKASTASSTTLSSKSTAIILEVKPAPDSIPVTKNEPSVIKTQAVAAPFEAKMQVPEASEMIVGKKVYDGICFACHATGVNNSPRLGSKESWAPRIAKGKAALVRSALTGTLKGMPARGSCAKCSDEDLQAAVEYMISSGQ